MLQRFLLGPMASSHYGSSKGSVAQDFSLYFVVSTVHQSSPGPIAQGHLGPSIIRPQGLLDCQYVGIGLGTFIRMTTHRGIVALGGGVPGQHIGLRPSIDHVCFRERGDSWDVRGGLDFWDVLDKERLSRMEDWALERHTQPSCFLHGLAGLSLVSGYGSFSRKYWRGKARWAPWTAPRVPKLVGQHLPGAQALGAGAVSSTGRALVLACDINRSLGFLFGHFQHSTHEEREHKEKRAEEESKVLGISNHLCFASSITNRGLSTAISNSEVSFVSTDSNVSQQSPADNGVADFANAALLGAPDSKPPMVSDASPPRASWSSVVQQNFASGGTLASHMDSEFMEDRATVDQSPNVDLGLADKHLNSCQIYATCTDQATDVVSPELVVAVQKVVLQSNDEAEKSSVSDDSELNQPSPFDTVISKSDMVEDRLSSDSEVHAMVVAKLLCFHCTILDAFLMLIEANVTQTYLEALTPKVREEVCCFLENCLSDEIEEAPCSADNFQGRFGLWLVEKDRCLQLVDMEVWLWDCVEWFSWVAFLLPVILLEWDK
ncbi:hypothetical protein Nepgr_007660 [Nepenthes gracilis]|uniref:Uncharacterized protein n=1 Tax=Nepenthes gracilis TaxID=150966 RepID=A0AAD3XIN3_NEPGR|nr:hypothetical protein Nepgr_007660 [Nepenthes gracilis]